MKLQRRTTKASATIGYTFDNPLDPANPIELFEYNLPNGTDFRYTMAPMIQAGVGLFKGSEIMARYSPTLDMGGVGKFGLWGIGLKLGVSEWIPGIKKIPLLNFSLIGGYTNLDLTSNINMTPEMYGLTTGFNLANYEDQKMILDISSLTANFVISADVKIFSIYGGVGFSQTKTNLKMKGNYPVPLIDPISGDLSLGTDITDPINITIKNTDGTTTKPRYNVGIRFKFTVITLNFDYIYADYSVITGGLGISFR